MPNDENKYIDATGKKPTLKDYAAEIHYLHTLLTYYGVPDGDDIGAYNLGHRVKLLGGEVSELRRDKVGNG